MAKSLEWYQRKIKAYRDAWRENYGVDCSKQNVALAVSVAIHETAAGDAWAGEDGIVGTSDDENNWGATTLRTLNDLERFTLATEGLERLLAANMIPRGDRLWFDSFRYQWQNLYVIEGVDVLRMQRALGVEADGKLGPKTLAAFTTEFGPNVTPEELFPDIDEALELTANQTKILEPITPTVAKGHAVRATEAMSVLRRRLLHTGYALPQAVIHCDSTPERGAYFVWFARFMSEKDGAKYFQRLLAGVEKRKAAWDVLERGGTTWELAEAMYSAGYYTGFFKPKQVYPDGRTGREKNIEAYAARISASYPKVLAAATLP